ncbi:hypothetical protein KSS87_006374 [Heliosperma pusillum]|nr:hypothetical protein KSS87_006374 [Heliosperma pusillum]
MDLLESTEMQILAVGVAVVVVIGTAAYFFSSKKKGCLDPENFKEFKLVKKTQLSHNVAKFTFGLPTPTSVLGLPIGQHISCRGKDSQGEEVMKAYTPTTLDCDVGRFELVIKMYPQGRMSHHFREMKVGDYLSVKGPKGRFKYQPGQVRAFGMLAGGSGITPMYQVSRAILENPNDKTKVFLIYANVTSEDILLKEELDSLAKTYPDRFKVYYVLNQHNIDLSQLPIVGDILPIPVLSLAYLLPSPQCQRSPDSLLPNADDQSNPCADSLILSDRLSSDLPCMP